MPYDIVELTKAVAEQPVGTQGTVIEEHESYALVEIGPFDVQELRFEALVEAPHEALRVIGHHELTASDYIIRERRESDLKFRSHFS